MSERAILGPTDLMSDLCTLVYGDLNLHMNTNVLRFKVGFFRDPLRNERIFSFNFGKTPSVIQLYYTVKSMLRPHLFDDAIMLDPSTAYERRIGKYHKILLEKGYDKSVLDCICPETILDIFLYTEPEGSLYAALTKMWFAWLYSGCINIEEI